MVYRQFRRTNLLPRNVIFDRKYHALRVPGRAHGLFGYPVEWNCKLLPPQHLSVYTVEKKEQVGEKKNDSMSISNLVVYSRE